jgi:hypothetical protein
MTTVFGAVRAPAVKVVVQTADGATGPALVKDEFFIYRHVDQQPWPGPVPTAVTQAFDANGSITAVGRW